MAIISTIGRRSRKVRLLFAGVYAVLMVGAVTMVYPFLLMISGSTKGYTDVKYFDAVPRFLHDEDWLYVKFAEGLFNESVLALDVAYDADYVSFEKAERPPAPNAALAAEWLDFLRASRPPAYAFSPSFIQTNLSRTIPSQLRAFKVWLRARCGEDIEAVNATLGSEYAGWSSVFLTPPTCLLRREKPGSTTFAQAVAEFAGTVPLELRYYFSPEGAFRKLYLKVQYSQKIEEYNRTHGTAYTAYSQVRLGRRFPADRPALEREDWEGFVRNTLALQWVRVDAAAAPAYRAFLQAKHLTVANLSKNHGTAYASFEAVPLVAEPPLSGMALSDWEAFIVGWRDPDTGQTHRAPTDSLRIDSVETRWQDALRSRFGTVDGVNRCFGTAYASLDEIGMPQRDLHGLYFQRHRRALTWEFCTRNYRAVGEYLLFHGRGISNTAVYCVLAILAALIVNPLAAYALSRYRMPSSYKILLFLMCTMAFPPMVTGIPSFLMLRKLHLLNTFAALILPGIANGYSIFLLKGFFDSLPRELYESAALDGANELVMFWHITMRLSTPILAVIALGAFGAAYSNFMFAFVVCQDEGMWTLMVWLYQLQQRSGQAVMYASLIIAAVPTFIIFLFCQNIIMRGIMVPSEK